MPWCPNCGAEYRAGYTVCSACGVPLVETPANVNPTVSADSPLDLVPLCERKNDAEADLLRQFLADSGIPVILRGRLEIDNLASMYTGNSLSGKRLFVNRCDLKQAQELIDAFQSGHAELLEKQAAEAPPEPEPEAQNGFGIILIPAVLLAFLFLAAGHGLVSVLVLIVAAILKYLWK